MNAEPFRYSDADWRKLEAIVARAGGDAAREKFAGERAAFEKLAGGWKQRIARWDGFKLGPSDDFHDKVERVGNAALEMVAALDDLSFLPLIFSGNDLVWRGPSEADISSDEEFAKYCVENQKRFSKFRGALAHIREKAGRVTAPKRKQKNLVRDRFFAALMRIWRVELGLRIRLNAYSPSVYFIEAASAAVLDKAVTREMISNVIRKWPRVEEEPGGV
jgi:hypothetical protein